MHFMSSKIGAALQIVISNALTYTCTHTHTLELGHPQLVHTYLCAHILYLGMRVAHISVLYILNCTFLVRSRFFGGMVDPILSVYRISDSIRLS